jgi:single-stranded DNA-binding protein
MLNVNGTVRVVSHGKLFDTRNGRPMGVATVVSSRSYTTAAGEAREENTFIDLIAFGNLARSVATRVPGERLNVNAQLSQQDRVEQGYARLDESGRVGKRGVTFRNYSLTARSVEFLTSTSDREALVAKHGLPSWQENQPQPEAADPTPEEVAEALASVATADQPELEGSES